MRSLARSERVRALNQMRSLISTAPDDLRDELRDLTVFRMLERAAAFRPGRRRDVTSLTKLSLRTLARRAISLREEIDEIDVILTELVNETAPALVTQVGVGVETACALLVTAGDNFERLRSHPEAVHALLGEPGTPPAHRIRAGVAAPSDLVVRVTVGCQQQTPCLDHRPVRQRGRPGPRLEGQTRSWSVSTDTGADIVNLLAP